MKRLSVALALCLLSANLFAQQSLEYSVSTVTYQFAASAEILADNDGVIILSSKLDPKTRYMARLDVKNQPNDYIEVYPESKPFPPQVLKSVKPGLYLIKGEPGSKFWVCIRSADAPVWVPIDIPTTGPPTNPPSTEPPASDFGALRSVAQVEAIKTQDSVTATNLAAAYLKVIASHQNADLATAVTAAKTARGVVFATNPLAVNWNNFIKATDAEFKKLNIATVSQYLAALRAVAESLDQAGKAIK